MALARPGRVKQVFRSAGLYHRIAQLHQAARIIAKVHDGVVPVDEEVLSALPGVGPYVGAIVASRLSGAKVVLIDTNSVRIATRALGVHPTTKDPRRERQVIEAVGELLGGPASADDWFAVIDLAHQVCRPRDPDCAACPIQAACAHAAMAGI
jgi:A/G-specific adenine glycosylase